MIGGSSVDVLPSLLKSYFSDTFHLKMEWKFGLTSNMSDDEKYTVRQILDEAWNYHGFGEYAVNLCSKLGGNWHCIMIESIPWYIYTTCGSSKRFVEFCKGNMRFMCFDS